VEDEFPLLAERPLVIAAYLNARHIAICLQGPRWIVSEPPSVKIVWKAHYLVSLYR